MLADSLKDTIDVKDTIARFFGLMNVSCSCRPLKPNVKLSTYLIATPRRRMAEWR
jgi:hypothetical protein